MKCISLSLSLSEEAPWRGPGGEAPSLGTLEDTLRTPDAGISIYGGSFVDEGNPECEGGLVYRALIDE
jgi:hypothetical protein